MIEPYFYQARLKLINFISKERVAHDLSMIDIERWLSRGLNQGDQKIIDYLRGLNDDELDAERDYYETFRNTIYVNQQERKVAWEAYKAASDTRLAAFDKRIQKTYKVPVFTDVVPVHAIDQSRSVTQNAQILLLEQRIDDAADANEFYKLAIAYPVETVVFAMR